MPNTYQSSFKSYKKDHPSQSPDISKDQLQNHQYLLYIPQNYISLHALIIFHYRFSLSLLNLLS